MGLGGASIGFTATVSVGGWVNFPDKYTPPIAKAIMATPRPPIHASLMADDGLGEGGWSVAGGAVPGSGSFAK